MIKNALSQKLHLRYLVIVTACQLQAFVAVAVAQTANNPWEACGIKMGDRSEAAANAQEWLPLSLASDQTHNPKAFRYLIRALGAGSFREQTIKRLGEEFSELASNENVSGSLIDQDYVHTFGGYDYGLILSVPPENIIATNQTDMGGGTEEEVRARYGLENPSTLLQTSRCLKRELEKDFPTGIFNEVRFNGLGTVRITGIFYRAGFPAPNLDVLRGFATKFKVPLIKLP